ncbi:uncharacterized protein V1513DRAFT_447467 [Lipomyces chichibuensis]|uniref:uncharacterized protein n=1 Tax=Lipomyces chichibuensis TaxID=1546026 RepID=UPI003343FC6C
MPDYLLLRPGAALDLAAIYAHIDHSCQQKSHSAPFDASQYRLTGPLPLIIMQCDVASPAWFDMYTSLQELIMRRFPINSEIQIIPMPRSLPSASASNDNASTEHAAAIENIVAKVRGTLSHMYSATENGCASMETVDGILASVNASGGQLGDFELSMLRDSFSSLSDLATRFANVAAALQESRHLDNANDVDDEEADVMRVSALALPVVQDIAEFWEDEFSIEV